jgi:hypothetical protein
MYLKLIRMVSIACGVDEKAFSNLKNDEELILFFSRMILG